MDHASTTPVHPEVLKAMKPFFDIRHANPSSLYKEGVDARNVLEASRKETAHLLGAQSDEIIFTASGTESDNLALVGVVQKAKEAGIEKPHIITSVIEHPAILEVCKMLTQWGCEVTYVPVDEEGIIVVSELKKALTENTVLVSVMYANNEIGTIQPVADIAKIVRNFRKSKVSKNNNYPYMHTDASQAANYLDLSVARLGVNLMTLDGGKMYGPKGVGVLFVQRGVVIAPIIFGGGQERGLRSGTENVALIVGCSRALAIAQSNREKESERLAVLRDYFFTELKQRIPQVLINGSLTSRLPNNVNVCIPNLLGEFGVIKLDALGVACSSSSSCRTTAENSSSYVVEALGRKNCSESSLRFTLGTSTTKKDIDVALGALQKLVD